MGDEPIRFDINTLTAGEALAAEVASGMHIQELIRTTSGRLLLAVFVNHLRSFGQPPSWQELINLRLLDITSGLSRSQADSQSVKSSASE